MTNSEAGMEHVGPFYSERTLDEVHSLIKDERDGVAVYISKDHAFATIGTRGIRPFDGASGLIIHMSVSLSDADPADDARRICFEQPFFNLAYTSATVDELKVLLVDALAEAGFVRSDARPG